MLPDDIVDALKPLLLAATGLNLAHCRLFLLFYYRRFWFKLLNPFSVCCKCLGILHLHRLRWVLSQPSRGNLVLLYGKTQNPPKTSTPFAGWLLVLFVRIAMATQQQCSSVVRKMRPKSHVGWHPPVGCTSFSTWMGMPLFLPTACG